MAFGSGFQGRQHAQRRTAKKITGGGQLALKGSVRALDHLCLE